jgi:hypothetical protein
MADFSFLGHILRVILYGAKNPQNDSLASMLEAGSA